MRLPFHSPEELDAAPAACGALRTGGRVVGVQGRDIVVRGAVASIRVRLRKGALPPLYSLVEASGAWDREALDATHLEVVGGPRGEAPSSDGDLAFLHASVAAAAGTRAGSLLLRARALGAIRAFFDEASFVEVDTPTVVPSPGLDLHLEAFEAEGGFLETSPEYQMKRLLSAGFTRIFQLGRSYRRDEAGPLHEPEFRMLEWYRAFAGEDEIMADTEALVAEVARRLLGTTVIPRPDGSIVDVAPPWDRLSVADAMERYGGVRLDDVLPDEERFYRTMALEVQPKLGLERPVFLTRFPASMASLARLCPDDPRYAKRFESFIAGIELSNGFDELTCPEEQRSRLERDQRARQAEGLPVYPIDERFLGALEDGIPPSGGNALGVDRLVMILAGAEAIEDVVWIPRRRL